ncbi:MAG: S9 family peptidase, partial [Sphingomonadales bacterium]
VYSVTPLVDTDLASVSRWVGVDSDSKHVKVLVTGHELYQNGYTLYGGDVIDWLPAEDGQVLMVRQYVPEYSQSLQTSSKDGIAVDRVNTRSGRADTIETPLHGIRGYIADGQGRVRIKGEAVIAGSGYDEGRTNWFYRKKGSDKWEPLGTTEDDEDNGFFPLGVDPSEDVVYGLKKLDGRLAA